MSLARNFAVRFPVVVGIDIVRSSDAEAASNAHLAGSANVPRPRIKMPFVSESMPEAHVAMTTPWPTARARMPLMSERPWGSTTSPPAPSAVCEPAAARGADLDGLRALPAVPFEDCEHMLGHV